MSDVRAHVLLVEDNRLISFNLQKELQAAGYDVSLASSGDDALAEVDRKKPDIILMDINLGENRDGVEIMQMIHAKHGFIANVFLTGYAEDEVSARADSCSPAKIVEKPVNMPVILELLDGIISSR